MKAADLHAEWMRDPSYCEVWEASEPRWRLVEALIGARALADLTQKQVAERMGTTQTAIARLEGGRSNPSVRTLERFAEATGTRVRISFEPAAA